MENTGRKVAMKVLVEFLAQTLPFKELDRTILGDLSNRCVIDYYLKGTMIFEQDVTEVTHLLLIQKGGVKVYRTKSDAEETLKEMCGEGAALGALSLVRGHKADVNVQALEDTFCFLLEKDAFLELVESDSRFAQFYLQNFSEDFTGLVYSELRSNRLKLRDQRALRLFNANVQALVKNPPVMISPSTTVLEAGAKMAEHGIGSLLVTNSAGGISGIVTDQDLRSKVVAQGMDYGTPVETIMTAPVYTIPAQDLCFEALLEFVKLGVDHLVVEDHKQIVGVVTARDIMVHQGTWPIYLVREIAVQRKIEGLWDLSQKFPLAVRTLIEQGARADSVTRVITLVNDSILTRLLDLLQEEMGPAPVPFCWLTLGGDGRREQTIKIDQDNALLYQDPYDRYQHEAAEAYFDSFTDQAIFHLEACGYPRSKKEIVAANSRWRKPYQIWQQYFDDWICTPDPREVSPATIFFDFRPNYGKESLGVALRNHCTSKSQRQHVFLAHLAADCLMNPPPLSFYGEFIVEQNGERKNRLDLKTRCLDPFSDFARLMALRYGIEETNTLSRLQLLSQMGRISMELFAHAREAYEFAIQLNLVHQLNLLEAGKDPDSYVSPTELSELERKILKETFAVVNKMLALLKREFPFLV